MQYLRMVECDLLLLSFEVSQFDPLYAGRIVSSPNAAADDYPNKNYGHDVLSWITRWVGIHAQDVDWVYLKGRFFHCLALHCVLDGFSFVYKPAWQAKKVFEWILLAPYH
jgi:hypothetical protein